MASLLADRIIAFNRNLRYEGTLPSGYKVVNPYLDNPETMEVMQKFYHKFYEDAEPRKFIIGINPSRLGAGVTGVPFTDTKRLEDKCGIRMETAHTHEISSVFMYDMISAFGGVELFYKAFYINSPFPLAIAREVKSGKWLNANYYDEKELYDAVKDFMVVSMKRHVDLGLDVSKVFVLGKKNALFVNKLNKEFKLFEDIVVLEHPRYIQQYKSKDKDEFILKYLRAFGGY